MKKYRTSEIVDEKLSVIRALGYVESDEKALKFIEWGASSGEVKTQDFMYLSGTMSVFHFDVMWKYLQDHWKFFNDNFAKSGFMFGSILRTIVSGTNDAAMINVFRKYFEDKDISRVTKSLEHAYTTIISKSHWLEMCREEDIVSWINKNC